MSSSLACFLSHGLISRCLTLITVWIRCLADRGCDRQRASGCLSLTTAPDAPRFLASWAQDQSRRRGQAHTHRCGLRTESARLNLCFALLRFLSESCFDLLVHVRSSARIWQQVRVRERRSLRCSRSIMSSVLSDQANRQVRAGRLCRSSSDAAREEDARSPAVPRNQGRRRSASREAEGTRHFFLLRILSS